MPYKDSEDKSLPDRIKKMAQHFRKAWVDTWNKTFSKTKSEGKSFATANFIVTKMLNASNGLFEIKGATGKTAVKDMKELTDDDIKSYGLDPEFCRERPNMKIIEGDLLLANTPFSPMVSDQLKEEGITTFILPADIVEANLNQLRVMPIHVSRDFSGHFNNGDGDGSGNLTGEYLSIGAVLGAKMVNREGSDEPWCRILGSLWEKDYPEEVAEISKRREDMGMSVEVFFSLQGLEATEGNAIKMNEFGFKGVAILSKENAAFKDSQLLVASKVDSSANTGESKMNLQITSDGTPEGTKVLVDGAEVGNLQSLYFDFSPEYPDGNKLSCRYSVGEDVPNTDWRKVTSFSLQAAEFVEAGSPEQKKTVVLLSQPKAKQEGGGNNMIKLEKETYGKDEVELLIAQAAGEKAGENEHQIALAGKDTEIATEKTRAEKAEGELKTAQDALAAKATAEKEGNAQVAAETFWAEHATEYPEENKEEITGIRKKMELGQASNEEVLKLASLKKTQSTLAAAGGDAESAKRKAELDKKFGIKDASKVS